MTFTKKYFKIKKDKILKILLNFNFFNLKILLKLQKCYLIFLISYNFKILLKTLNFNKKYTLNAKIYKKHANNQNTK